MSGYVRTLWFSIIIGAGVERYVPYVCLFWSMQELTDKNGFSVSRVGVYGVTQIPLYVTKTFCKIITSNIVQLVLLFDSKIIVIITKSNIHFIALQSLGNEFIFNLIFTQKLMLFKAQHLTIQYLYDQDKLSSNQVL